MLHLVPTPLGNLQDLSARALQVLAKVRAVYCEDTRRTRVLLSAHGLSTPLVRYRDDDPRGLERILERLRRGEELALVSDSGTPVVSDPGLALVAAARRERLTVSSLPGPCAAVAAVAGSGLPGDSFVFLGFLPRSASKQVRILREAAALERTLVVYESPYRVKDTLASAEEALGPDAQAVACRELSKLHEEWLGRTVSEVRASLEARAEILGEFVLVLHPRRAP